MKNIINITVCATIFSLQTVATAQSNTNENTEANTVVVTATREERLAEHTPFSVNVMQSDDIRLGKASRTVPEALKNQPGIMVQKTGHAQGSPYVRGFTGFRNLLMIDSVRLNNSVFRDGPNQYWNTVDAFGLNRLESVRGPASVLYGSDAIGGTVNAITSGAQDMRPGSDWDRRLYMRLSSAEESYVTRAETIGYLTDNLILSLGYSAKSYGDLSGGSSVGTQPKTGYDEIDWDAKLEYFLGDDAKITLAHQDVDIDDAWRTHKTIYGIDWEGLSVGKELRRSFDQDRQLSYLQYHQYNIDGLFDEVHAGISHHRQQEERDRLRPAERHDIQGFDVNTLGAFITLKTPSRFGQWIYGSEYYHDNVDSFNTTLNPDGSVRSQAIQGPVGDDATYDTVGIYAQNEITLTETASMILGGRYEYAEAKANSVQDPSTGLRMSVSDDWDSLVGSGRFINFLDSMGFWNIYAGISQGFRAPNLSDLTRLDSARTDEIETPSPDLDPERFIAYELGVKGGYEELSGQMAYFYTDISDMIVRTPTGRLIDGEKEITKKNSGDGYLHGVELELRYRLLESWEVFGFFTWIDGKVDTYPTSEPTTVREPIDRMMPPTGTLGCRYIVSDQAWIEASCSVATKADKLSTRDKADTSRIPSGGTPGYAVCDLRAGWDITSNLAVSTAIENLTDEDYRIHGSGINESGRNLILSADYTF